MIRFGMTRATRWYQNFCRGFISSEDIRKESGRSVTSFRQLAKCKQIA